jgi:hypothetical protein
VLPEGGEEILSSSANAIRQTMTDGECIYFAINNVTNSPRGRSELLVVADWLDAYEQFLFDYADRWPLLNTFVWDLMVQGGTDETIKAELAKFTKKSGSVYGHNEKVTAEARAPQLQSYDAAAGARMFRNHILGAKGLPEHWYGGGGDVNLATAKEMDMPTLKMMGEKQRYFKFILESVIGFVIARAREAGYLRVSDEQANAWSVMMPELAAKDITKYATAIQQLLTSLGIAQQNGWVDKDTALKVFAFCIAMIGYELDPEAIKKAVEKEEKEREQQDYLKKPSPDMKPGQGDGEMERQGEGRKSNQD